MNQWPIKLIAGEDPPHEGEQLYLTNANNNVAYLYREERNGYFGDDDIDMVKIGWIPANANPPLDQRELPLKVLSKIVPVPATEQDRPVSAGIVKKEYFVTTVLAETKEERAIRLYGNKDSNFVTYKGVKYYKDAIPKHLEDEIRAAQMFTPNLAISNNIGGSTIKHTLNNPNYLTTTKEEPTMTMISQILQVNKNAAEAAAQLELGRVANATLETILAKKFPNLPSTPFNALVIANLASVIGKQVKPSPKLEKLTNAMVTSAYGEVFQILDLEGMIKELLDAVGDKLVD